MPPLQKGHSGNLRGQHERGQREIRGKPAMTIQEEFAARPKQNQGKAIVEHDPDGGLLMKIIRKGLEYIGGRWWRCVKCEKAIQADCECCEPPACGCQREKTKQ
jgi:hypothetical protein